MEFGRIPLSGDRRRASTISLACCPARLAPARDLDGTRVAPRASAPSSSSSLWSSCSSSAACSSPILPATLALRRRPVRGRRQPPRELPVALVGLFVAAIGGNIAGYRDRESHRTEVAPARRTHHRAQVLRPDREVLRQARQQASSSVASCRSCATFVTGRRGHRQMDRKRFFTWSAIGAALWPSASCSPLFSLGAAFPTLGEQIDKAVIVID